MAETPAPKPEPKNTIPRPARDKATRKQFYTWFGILSALLLFLAFANITINRKDVQRAVADYLYKKAQIKADFEDIHLELFTGTLSGKGISVDFQKNNYFLSLKQFKVHFNPLFFLIGKVKINAVIAKEIFLDTSYLKKTEKQKRKNIPDFLKHINLQRAQIDQFFWNQGQNGYVYVGHVEIASKFGSLFYKSPTQMVATNLRYIGPKVHLFAEKIIQDGFFIFDLSQPRIFDESRIASQIEIRHILLGLQKKPKPWLTNPGWDDDLTPVIQKFYDNNIPNDKSYLYVQRFNVDFEKNRNSFVLTTFTTQIQNSKIKASGNYNKSTGIFTFGLKSDKPIPFSKLPLGQSQIRQAFDSFEVELNANGSAKALDKNNIRAVLKGKFHGNKINPAAGDPSVEVDATITNAKLNAKKIAIKMGQGTVNGNGTLDLPTITADLDYTCDDFDIQTIIRLFSTVNIPGIADCQGSLSQKLNNPRIQVNMTSPDASYEFLHFGAARGDLLLDGQNLKLNVNSTASAVGNSQLTMTISNVFDSFTQVLDLDSHHEGIDIQKLLNAKSLRGRISGNFNLKRRDTILTATGDFKAHEFYFFDRLIGDVSTKLNLQNKHLNLSPVVLDLNNPKTTITSPKGFEFDFDQNGYRFTGFLVPELSVQGQFQKTDRNHLKLDLKANELPLRTFTALLPFEPQKSTLTGDFNIAYNVYEPILSQMQGRVQKLNVQVPEGEITLQRPAVLNYDNKAFQFQNMALKVGDGQVNLNGALGLEQNSSLHVVGDIDFNVIADFNPFIAESDKPIAVDVTFKNDIFSPQLFGKVILKEDNILFRSSLSDLQDLTGTLNFDGNRITTSELKFFYDDAPSTLSGYVTTDYKFITGADLNIDGNEIPMHMTNGLNFLADVDLTLKGTGTMTLAGKVNILEGQYNRDFGLTNFIVRPSNTEFDELEGRRYGMLPENTNLNLDIKNTGDFLIKNNLAELEIQTDLQMQGTLIDPRLIGQVDIVSGEINAFGIAFEDATGYVQFKRDSGLNPEVNLVAKKSIQEYEIQARLQGKFENLRMRLDSTPSLDRREILSLLFYGQTPDQLVGDYRRQFTQTAAISQLASVLSKPIYRISGLDVIEVSSRQETSNTTIQRLSVGKSLSNRFNLLFTTDLGIEDPERAFEAEYQAFDNIYLIIAKDIGERDRYRFDVNLRLEAY